jgi:hypothetical protein
MMENDISISYTLVPGTEMIKIYEQIKAGEYKLKKRR